MSELGAWGFIKRFCPRQLHFLTRNLSKKIAYPIFDDDDDIIIGGGDAFALDRDDDEHDD